MLFCLLNLLSLWRSLCRPRRWILKSLIRSNPNTWTKCAFCEPWIERHEVNWKAIKCGSVSYNNYNDLHIYNIIEDENEYMKIILNNCGVKDDLNERLRRSSFIYYNTVLLSWVKLNMFLALLNRKKKCSESGQKAKNKLTKRIKTKQNNLHAHPNDNNKLPTCIKRDQKCINCYNLHWLYFLATRHKFRWTCFCLPALNKSVD